MTVTKADQVDDRLLNEPEHIFTSGILNTTRCAAATALGLQATESVVVSASFCYVCTHHRIGAM